MIYELLNAVESPRYSIGVLGGYSYAYHNYISIEKTHTACPVDEINLKELSLNETSVGLRFDIKTFRGDGYSIFFTPYIRLTSGTVEIINEKDRYEFYSNDGMYLGHTSTKYDLILNQTFLDFFGMLNYRTEGNILNVLAGPYVSFAVINTAKIDYYFRSVVIEESIYPGTMTSRGYLINMLDGDIKNKNLFYGIAGIFSLQIYDFGYFKLLGEFGYSIPLNDFLQDEWKVYNISLNLAALFGV